jgi:protein-tyrosine-phosphatase
MDYLDTVSQNFASISPERKQTLEALARFVQEKVAAGEEAQLIFICTHNSRRSHLGQLWAQAAAHYYGVPRVRTYSGGTEATAFHPNAVAALKRAGFVIETINVGDNPRYRVAYGEEVIASEVFSKKYDDVTNPQQDFAAVMTCTQADADCPLVPGASRRITLPYDDPKEADGTPEEASRYDERCRQIATEMMYCFSRI